MTNCQIKFHLRVTNCLPFYLYVCVCVCVSHSCKSLYFPIFECMHFPPHCLKRFCQVCSQDLSNVLWSRNIIINILNPISSVCVHAPVCVCAFEISCSTLWEIAVFRCLLTNLQSEQIKQWCFSSAKTGLNMGVAALCDKRTSCNRLLFSLCSRAKLDKTGVIRENLLSLLNGWEIRPNDFLQLNIRIQGTILIAIIRTHTHTHAYRQRRK